MNIEVAKSAGFCFGVDRAVNILNDEILNRGDNPLYTLGQLIHNPQIISELQSKGVLIANEVEELPFGATVVIRTHGVTKDVLDKIAARDCKIIDATCPFVQKIQKSVSEQSNEGQTIFIAGDILHPEVEGIIGYAKNHVFTFNSLSELMDMAKKNDFLTEKPITMVVQTTFSKKEWEKIKEYAKKIYTNIKIFDTICNATEKRQSEVEHLAKKSDAFIVIGGKNSSNSTKLYEIAKKICSDTFFIETSGELPVEYLKTKKNIGITAGASTPLVSIKEVIKTMEENIIANEKEELSFEQALEQSFKTLQNGDRVLGTVVAISDNEIQMDLGTKQAGYISAAEFSADPNARISELVKVGDELMVQVVRLNDVEGTVMLSTKRIEAAKGFGEVVDAFKDGTVLSGTITENVNAGVIANYKGTKVFIPASQSGVAKDGDLNTLLNTVVSFKILDLQLGGRRRKIIGSIKNAFREARSEAQDKVFGDIEIGKKYTGKVKSLTSFGAFVDIGGVDGMVHITELSWSKIKHPSEIVNIGDTVDVYIKDFDKETKRISLGYKNNAENPFEIFKAKYSEGDEVDITIVRIMPFGAFGEIIPGVDGLVHISQISNNRVNKIHDFLKIGEVVKAKITQIDEEKNKISLSIKALLQEEEISTEEEPDTELISAEAVIDVED